MSVCSWLVVGCIQNRPTSPISGIHWVEITSSILLTTQVNLCMLVTVYSWLSVDFLYSKEVINHDQLILWLLARLAGFRFYFSHWTLTPTKFEKDRLSNTFVKFLESIIANFFTTFESASGILATLHDIFCCSSAYPGHILLRKNQWRAATMGEKRCLNYGQVFTAFSAFDF